MWFDKAVVPWSKDLSCVWISGTRTGHSQAAGACLKLTGIASTPCV